MRKVLLLKSISDPDSAFGKEGAHGRIDMMIRAGYLKSGFFEHAGQCSHPRAANSDEMNGFDLFGYPIIL